MEKDKLKTKKVSIQVTPEKYQLIKEEAERLQLPLASLVKTKLFSNLNEVE